MLADAFAFAAASASFCFNSSIFAFAASIFWAVASNFSSSFATLVRALIAAKPSAFAFFSAFSFSFAVEEACFKVCFSAPSLFFFARCAASSAAVLSPRPFLIEPEKVGIASSTSSKLSLLSRAFPPPRPRWPPRVILRRIGFVGLLLVLTDGMVDSW